MRISRILVLLVTMGLNISAQEIAIGQWRDHLVYRKGTSVALAGDQVYCAADGGLFSVYLPEGRIDRLSKVEGFSRLKGKKRTALCTLPEKDEQTTKSIRNLPQLSFEQLKDLNLVDVLNHKYLVMIAPEKSVELLEKKLQK